MKTIIYIEHITININNINVDGLTLLITVVLTTLAIALTIRTPHKESS